MKGYLFDLTALVEPLSPAPSPGFVRRLRSTATGERWTTSVVVGELLYAARRTGDQGVLTASVRLIAAVRVAPFDAAAARTYAKLAASMTWAGTAPAAVTDLMTAAVARTLELTVVTRRRALFEKVPQLLVEDWTES